MELTVRVIAEDGIEEEKHVSLPVYLGRQPDCAIRLKGWSVAKQHARIFESSAAIWLEDLGALSGTLVNGKRIVQYGPILPQDEIFIGAYLIKVETTVSIPLQGNVTVTHGEDQRVHNECTLHLSSHTRRLWQQKIYHQLLEALDLKKRDISQLSDEALKLEATKVLKKILSDHEDDLPRDIDRDDLSKHVLDEAIGLGPLEDLLEDATITEIMVNQYDEIFVEVNGCLSLHHRVFSSHQAVLGVIQRIVSPLGRRIDESSPMVDARLKDGSRVNAVIPPIALKGPSLTIRKFPVRRLGIDDLINVGALSAGMAQFLELCIQQRLSVVVSGGTGSGKTTLLNILSSFIPDTERVITIEDAAELKLHHRNLVSLESRPANIEGRGAVLIRDLVRNALRMRPDRIVVGECRGAEALDMLQAMNTGHEGSLTTLHANTPRDALARLETMVLMAGMDLPLSAIREQIASAVNIIVQQSRLNSGHRVITGIVEVTGIESGRIQLQPLFQFEKNSMESTDIFGQFKGTNMVPSLLVDLDLDRSIFSQSVPARRHVVSLL